MPPGCGLDPAEEIASEIAGRHELLTRIIPKLSGLLSQGVETLLDLRWGRPSQVMPHAV